MKTYRDLWLPLTLFFGLLLIPRTAEAQVTNCPVEPKSDVAIADGETYSGANCTLKSAGDIDSFVFNASAGDNYQIVLGLVSGVQAEICVTLYDPNLNIIFPNTNNPNNCTTWNGFGGTLAVVDNQALTLTGTYQMNVTESSSATQQYALSLERVFPFPPNAVEISTLGTLVNADIAAPTQSNAFTFTGATTGEFEVTSALTGGVNANVCLAVYSPTGALVTPATGTGTNPICTTWNGFGGTLFVSVDFTPTEAGTYMGFVQAVGNDGTQTYTMEVSCLTGKCGSTTTPPCTLKNSLSYSASTSTLTMNFTEGNSAVDTWNAWLTDQNTMTNLFTVSQPVTTEQPITKTTTLSPEGIVGVLSTLTTPKKGIICSVYTQINTGTPK